MEPRASMPFARKRGRPPTKGPDSITPKTQNPMETSQMTATAEAPTPSYNENTQNTTGSGMVGGNLADHYGNMRLTNSVAPGTTVMNYEEYQQF